jgi:hypothetical protein
VESALGQLRSHPCEETALKSLVCAGELECALCDAGSDDTGFAAAITDRLATLLCRTEGALSKRADCIDEAAKLLDAIQHSGEVTVSRPEGFAYYALHPLQYADLVSAARLDTPSVLVIGIRSIGTTLSAVVAAQLNATSIFASRTTVRPTGDPYDRRTLFAGVQRGLVKRALSQGAIFLIVDEGPGRSGSSFLSVAEALEAEGARRERIILLCSYEPDVDALCAPNGPERWRRYPSLAAGMTKRLPARADQYIGGGEWRHVFPTTYPWPASWPAMERLKFLSRDKQTFFKFEGLGQYGEQVREREQMLAAEFGAGYLGQERGFGIHVLAAGTCCGPGDVTPALLRHIARYCTWRTVAFPAKIADHSISQLEQMANINCERGLGFAPDLRLDLQRPVICDGRMQPYKWIAVGEHRWIKLDGSTHGDDHFFPGPSDIAWDLAGACVEWNLSASAREFFLNEYTRLSGDRPDARLPGYELAYSAFRLGWSQMAAASVACRVEQERLLNEAERYRRSLRRVAPAPTLAA